MSHKNPEAALIELVTIIKALGLPDAWADSVIKTVCELKNMSASYMVLENLSSLKCASKRNIANRFYKTNLFREELLNYKFCRDPAWNMMLDLYTANENGSEVTVSSLCAASNVPSSTALRQISSMEQYGLVRRKPVDGHARLVHVEPTERMIEAVTATINRFCGLPTTPAQD